MEAQISNLLNEKRVFPPSDVFSKQAHVRTLDEYKKLYALAEADPDRYWADLARKYLRWDHDFATTCKWTEPFAKWFLGGKLNASVQCLDKNLPEFGEKTALLWEAEGNEKALPELKSLTYQQLFDLTCQTSNALSELGVKSGDRVAIYMPMVPEAVASMLACARIGAIHSVIFGGFSSESLKDRINDMQCKAVITADGGYRRGANVPLKENIDVALEKCPSVEKVLVLKRTGQKVSMKTARDFWWETLVNKQKKDCAPFSAESEHPLFILYTSGTTGKAKGIVHSTAGYLLQAQVTTKQVFDLKPKDIFWCTADIGWITGHSYVVYGPLQNAATVFLYEGAPNYPDYGRFWKMIEKHRISILYTAPTAIRAFMRAGEQFITPYNLSSLRVLGSVGEPINPEAWIWYHKMIGKEHCPIVDTWWQTETGTILMSPLPGATPTKPGSCTFPLPGIFPEIVKRTGEKCAPNEGGFLVINKPWPSIARGIYGDPERFKKTYWSDFKGRYFTGDGARQDEDGYFWVMGRVDDVLNVSGHRLGTAEIESALVSHPRVAEAAVVGKPDEIKGQAVVAFVTLKSENPATSVTKDRSPNDDQKLIEELKSHVAKEIGSIAKPDEIRFTESLPKTRSGKIMRRLLRELSAGGKVKGDTSTLEDMSVVNSLSASYEEED